MRRGLVTDRSITQGDADTVRDGARAAPAASSGERGRELSLGPYRLLEHIGGGGMGVIFRAERL